MPVTKPQAEMLTALAVAARPHGARRWDPAGVMAALLKVRHLELATVGMAVLRAASDRTVDTPGVLGNLGAPCWTERPVERWQPDKTTPADRCGICGKPRSVCETAPRFADDTHAFESDFRRPSGSAVDELRDIKAAAMTDRMTPTEEDFSNHDQNGNRRD